MKEKQKKFFAAVTLVIALAVMGFITVAITLQLRKIGSAPEDMREFFASFGWGAPAVALGLQVLQILIAFIPGEFVESGMGFAFGAPIGALLCYIGLAIGEALVFILIRRFGTRALTASGSASSTASASERILLLVFMMFVGFLICL